LAPSAAPAEAWNGSGLGIQTHTGRHSAGFDDPWRNNFQLTLGRYHDHWNRRLPDDLSREPATQERPRLSFASCTEEDEKSPLFCSDRDKSLGNVANLGPSVDAAHELLVVEDVGEDPLGVPSHAKDRWSLVELLPTAEAVRDMDRNDPEAERFRQLCCDAEC
jgi:hypothetical protein